MTLHSLLKTLADGNWHSADRLSGDRQQSLAAEIAWLQDQGLALEHDSQLGYRLEKVPELLDRRQILQGLGAGLGESLACFDLQVTIDSTNSQAMRWLRGGAGGRGLFLAEKQESGRGRRGRTWVSPLARNIYMSLVWPVAGLQSALEGFSLVTALSLVDGLHKAGLLGLEGLQVKWPNDVWLDGAKLAGILLELHRGPAGNNHVIVGMGVNVHMPEEALLAIDQPVTDLYSQGNHAIDRNRLVAAILASLAEKLETLHEQGFEAFRSRWLALDALYDCEVEVIGGQQKLTGVARGVSATGALILQTEAGERHINGGEIAPSLRVRA